MSTPVNKHKKMENFADWVNPMLVKELRQGLRSNAFLGMFLLSQVILCFILLIAIGNDNVMSAADTAGKVIFGLFAFLALVLQPLRGVSTLSNELKDGHMELVSLTQLTAWRTVWSKWCAIMLQSLLLLTAILPFITLRYFFGGADLFMEVMMYVLVMICSGALTAGMIANSSLKLRVLKSFFTLGVVITGFQFFVFASGGRIFSSRLSTFGITSGSFWLLVVGILLLAAYFTFVSLTVAVRSIAPQAENHSTKIRAVTLGVLLITSTIFHFSGSWGWTLDDSQYYLSLLTLLAIIALFSLSEKSAEISSYLAVKQRKKLRLLDWILAPGWQFGFWAYSLALLIFTIGNLAYPDGSFRSFQNLIIFSLLFAACLIPIVILPPLKKRINFTNYATVGVILFSITLVLGILVEQYGRKDFSLLAWVLLPLPPISFGVNPDWNFPSKEKELFAFCALGVFFLYWIGIAITSVRSIKKQVSNMENLDV